jgi:hypothetical protein
VSMATVLFHGSWSKLSRKHKTVRVGGFDADKSWVFISSHHASQA